MISIKCPISIDDGTRKIFKDNRNYLIVLYTFYFSVLSGLFYFAFVESPFVIKNEILFFLLLGCFVSFIVAGIVVNSYYTKTYIEDGEKISFYKIDPKFLFFLVIFLLSLFGFTGPIFQESIGIIIVLIFGMFVLFMGVLQFIKPKKMIIEDGSIKYEDRRHDKQFKVKLSDIEKVNIDGMLAKNHGLEIITADETYNCSLGNRYNRMISEMIKERI